MKIWGQKNRQHGNFCPKKLFLVSIYYRGEYNIPSKHHFGQIRLRVYPRQNFTHGCAHWFWQRFPSNQKIDRPVSLFQENTLVLFEKSDWKITMLLFFVGKHMPCQSVHLQQTNDLFPPFWDDYFTKIWFETQIDLNNTVLLAILNCWIAFCHPCLLLPLKAEKA